MCVCVSPLVNWPYVQGVPCLWPEMVAIKPNRALVDLQKRMGENPQIQMCKSCGIIPKKTLNCNLHQIMCFK